ncbi:unnamed protein product [Protopolystoma xenopodis]|uniref:Dynein light chain n=1 Tax=Protopolystoma xenopodis TaxID=117903 RepID=A0A3S5AG39_9PLAT|nr:unnamed protein product [Protopolystoma xenopodis]
MCTYVVSVLLPMLSPIVWTRMSLFVFMRTPPRDSELCRSYGFVYRGLFLAIVSLLHHHSFSFTLGQQIISIHSELVNQPRVCHSPSYTHCAGQFCRRQILKDICLPGSLDKSGCREASRKAPTFTMSRRDPDLPADIEVIQADMPLELKQKIINFVRPPLEELRQQGSTANLRFEPITQELKRHLDTTDGPLWHVVILVGQFTTHFSYSPGCLFHFKLGRFIVLAWKTPHL